MNTLISKVDFPKFFQGLCEHYEMIAPVNKGKVTVFAPVKEFKEIDFSRQTDYSPKKFLTPAVETILTYQKDKATLVMPQTKRIIVVHPCDANAIQNHDRIFLDEYPDPLYKERRENTMLFVFNCLTSYKNCFCTSVNACETVNYDLLFVDIGDKYVVSVGSAKARELINSKMFTNIIREGTSVVKNKKKLMNINLLGPNFSNKVWINESKRCLFCNACISVCPSCYCFTIRDEPNLDLTSGKRTRFWDYCYMQDHTKVAGGYVFRKERSKRFKHRIYHQLKYFKDKYGKHLCVGCGRCIDVCPAKIDMVEIVNTLK